MNEYSEDNSNDINKENKNKAENEWDDTNEDSHNIVKDEDDWNPTIEKDDITERVSKYSHYKLAKIAISKGGKLLTTRKEFNLIKTPPSLTKFRWKCKDGHEFELTPAAIKQGRWCPKEYRSQPWTYQRLINLAKKRGIEENNIPGSLLTTENEYNNLKKLQQPIRTKYLWSCGVEGHEPWDTRPDVINGGSWCPSCSSQRNQPYTYEEIKNIALNRGIEETKVPGRIITTHEEYTLILNDPNREKSPSKIHLLWKCGNKEHEPWESTITNINQGRWCPRCSEGKCERITRFFFESIFKAKFPKKYPKWLQKLTGHRLELDGYNESLKIAFEFNGTQHYSPIYGVVKYNKQLELDELKSWACEKKGVLLITIPHYFDGNENYIDFSKMQDYIIKRYEELTNKKLSKMPRFDYRTRNIKRLDEF